MEVILASASSIWICSTNAAGTLALLLVLKRIFLEKRGQRQLLAQYVAGHFIFLMDLGFIGVDCDWKL